MNIADNATTPWIRRYHQAAEAGTRLVCFPHAGGSASYFHPVSARFAPDVDVVSLQYPGRQDRRREPCVDTIAGLADLVTTELLALSAKPTVFFGHSMGAVLAFEVALRLADRGAPGPGALIASGRRGPSTHRDERIHERDDDGIIAEVKDLNKQDLTVLGGDEILRMALPAIRNDYRAIETYTCAADRRVGCPVTVLIGTDDPKVTAEEAENWRDHTDGAFRLEVFPGGHFFLARHQGAVNGEILRELRALQAPVEETPALLSGRDST
ncbi:thioesterase II family protein [Amycolatopsis sp. NBC_00438]|uniref:thioesterase II family protein n=1 Tax=Amycolatopsis sp. NBC_00438 TaxID=2903558 RepID=UPI002E1F56F6